MLKGSETLPQTHSNVLIPRYVQPLIFHNTDNLIKQNLSHSLTYQKSTTSGCDKNKVLLSTLPRILDC